MGLNCAASILRQSSCDKMQWIINGFRDVKHLRKAHYTWNVLSFCSLHFWFQNEMMMTESRDLTEEHELCDNLFLFRMWESHTSRETHSLVLCNMGCCDVRKPYFPLVLTSMSPVSHPNCILCHRQQITGSTLLCCVIGVCSVCSVSVHHPSPYSI